MMVQILPLVFDALILLFLGVTIFYAAKLTKQLKLFRQNRSEIAKLVVDLTGRIDQAERAIQGLRAAARESGRNLQAALSEARAAQDELEVMCESAGRLASRLEKSARGVGHVAGRRAGGVRQSPVRDVPQTYQEPEEDSPFGAGNIPRDSTEDRTAVEEKPPVAEKTNKSGASPFMIRDPEFDAAGNEADDDDSAADFAAMDDYDNPAAGMSRAERELYEALQGRKTIESAGEV